MMIYREIYSCRLAVTNCFVSSDLYETIDYIRTTVRITGIVCTVLYAILCDIISHDWNMKVIPFGCMRHATFPRFCACCMFPQYQGRVLVRLLGGFPFLARHVKPGYHIAHHVSCHTWPCPYTLSTQPEWYSSNESMNIVWNAIMNSVKIHLKMNNQVKRPSTIWIYRANQFCSSMTCI